MRRTATGTSEVQRNPPEADKHHREQGTGAVAGVGFTPDYPHGNGRIERSFRTDHDEFHHVHDLPADFGGLKNALIAWNQRYESWRLHQALGYLTPDQFYQQWLSKRPQRMEAVSDMS